MYLLLLDLSDPHSPYMITIIWSSQKQLNQAELQLEGSTTV